MYLLDTDVLSHLVKAAPPAALLERFSHLRKQDLYTSSVNQGELLYGLFRLRKGRTYFQRAERLWQRLCLLSFDSYSAEIYGQLRAELERRGTPLPDVDLMIASVALGNALILVTGNVRHFSRVPNLQIENWLRGM